MRVPSLCGDIWLFLLIAVKSGRRSGSHDGLHCRPRSSGRWHDPRPWRISPLLHGWLAEVTDARNRDTCPGSLVHGPHGNSAAGHGQAPFLVFSLVLGGRGQRGVCIALAQWGLLEHRVPGNWRSGDRQLLGVRAQSNLLWQAARSSFGPSCEGSRRGGEQGRCILLCCSLIGRRRISRAPSQSLGACRTVVLWDTSWKVRI
mmetsp:Transcript_31804/g.92390  ORF Transcript_31804/g.92390 Transcript_31804/m.92390 type:complete len:202 (-) Transcript_31804:858-1463(-)